jgi:hypothetical protein
MIQLIGDKLWQWDLNRKVIVDSNSNIVISELHFVDYKSSCTLKVIPKLVNGVLIGDIPNVLLQQTRDIVIYGVRINDDVEHTEYSVRFPVEPRQKPSDYIYTETEIKSYETLEKRIKALESTSTNGSTTPVKIGEAVLLANKWVGTENLFSQIVSINGVTTNSQVDLTPSVEQLAVFYEKDLTLVTENEDGVVTVYAIGQKPQNDYTIQVTITEVAYE